MYCPRRAKEVDKAVCDSYAAMDMPGCRGCAGPLATPPDTPGAATPTVPRPETGAACADQPGPSPATSPPPPATADPAPEIPPPGPGPAVASSPRCLNCGQALTGPPHAVLLLDLAIRPAGMTATGYGAFYPLCSPECAWPYHYLCRAVRDAAAELLGAADDQ